MESEEILTGGNMSAVARVGQTVRREAGAWTPQVQRLLRHLRDRGILEVPEPLGFDEQGREVVSFIPGTVGHGPLPEELCSDAILTAAARLLGRIHAATREVSAAWPTGWRVPAREPVEVICHGDFAPYNCVFAQGRLVGVIDFDHAHPGSRAWDLAYALYRFVPLMAPSNPESRGSLADQRRRLGLFCDAYGLEERAGLGEVIAARILFMADYLREGAARGDEHCRANIEAGHLAIYLNDYAYFQAQW